VSFTPLLPLGGYAGWRFLSATAPDQSARLAETAVQARDMQYFRDTIGSISEPKELVSDYRLLRVALGAYGLQDDLPNKAFIERILSDGTLTDDALPNRLADKRYKAFSEAFGFGTGLPPRTRLPGFADKVLTRFSQQEFERAVGTQDPDMRLALTAQRELPDLAARGLSDTAAWFTVLGNPPLRQVFETAFGLPSSIGQLDLDQQLGEFRAASERVLGHAQIDRFGAPEAVEDLLRNFTIRAQIAAGPSPLTPGLAALTLLQGLA
jgi:hypothetical protein